MIENAKTHSAKYQVLYNRLTNGTPFTTDTARGLLGTAYSELDCINFIRFCTFKADARKAK